MSAPTWHLETDTAGICGRTALYKDQGVIGVMSDEALVLCLCGHASRRSYDGLCCRCDAKKPEKKKRRWRTVRKLCNICVKDQP